MKRFLLALGFLLALPLSAQEGTVTPITRPSEERIKIRKFGFDTNTPGLANTALFEISVRTSVANGDIETRYFNVLIPAAVGSPCTATIPGLSTAMLTALPGPSPPAETGGDGRRIQYRMLNYLSVQGCLPGVTPVP